jgi:hypothetical protein
MLSQIAGNIFFLGDDQNTGVNHGIMGTAQVTNDKMKNLVMSS